MNTYLSTRILRYDEILSGKSSHKPPKAVICALVGDGSAAAAAPWLVQILRRRDLPTGAGNLPKMRNKGIEN